MTRNLEAQPKGLTRRHQDSKKKKIGDEGENRNDKSKLGIDSSEMSVVTEKEAGLRGNLNLPKKLKSRFHHKKNTGTGGGHGKRESRENLTLKVVKENRPIGDGTSPAPRPISERGPIEKSVYLQSCRKLTLTKRTYPKEESRGGDIRRRGVSRLLEKKSKLFLEKKRSQRRKS